MHLNVAACKAVNFDEMTLFISVLPRKTYDCRRIACRKIPKERLTVGFIINAEGTPLWRALIISKAKKPYDFCSDWDPEPYYYLRSNEKRWMIFSDPYPLNNPAGVFAAQHHLFYDQGLIATVKARYWALWLQDVMDRWRVAGAHVRHRPDMRDVV
ncbi:unnamed protein product [Closterium sp. Yama58-4]|nr:unnamed protein product [Closterium sp. Yama58-4]